MSITEKLWEATDSGLKSMLIDGVFKLYSSCTDVVGTSHDAFNFAINIIGGQKGYEQVGDYQGKIIPYYDFDRVFPSRSEMNDSRDSDLERCISSLKDVWGKDVMNTTSILDASGYSIKKDKWKVSFHFVVRGYGYFSSGKEMIQGEYVPKVFDKLVYSKAGKRQLFRPAFSSKEGENRKLMPIDEDGSDIKGFNPFEVLFQNSVQFVEPTERLIVVAPKARVGVAKKSKEDETKYSEEIIRGTVMGLSIQRAIDRESWVNVVFALSHIGEEMRGVAHEFSRRFPEKYDHEEVDRCFDDGGSGYGMGSLIHWIKEDNEAEYMKLFKPAEYIASLMNKTNEVASLAKRLTTKTAGVVVSPNVNVTKLEELFGAPGDEAKMSDERQWSYKDWEYFHINARQVKSSELMEYFEASFIRVKNKGKMILLTKNIMPNGSVEFESDTPMPFRGFGNDFLISVDGGKEVKISKLFEQYILKHSFDYIDFVPYLYQDPTPAKTYNTFQGFQYPYREVGEEELSRLGDIVKPILDHFKILSPQFHKRLIWFVADIFQNPARKPTHCHMIKGVQGCGKTIMLAFIQEILGPSLTETYISLEQLTGKFNLDLAGNLLNVTNEAVNFADSKGAEVLKSLITDATIKIEPKGQNRYTVKDFSRLLGSSNKDQCLPVDVGDRRGFLSEASSEKVGDGGYFKALRKCMDDHAGEFWDYMTNVDISEYDPYEKALMSDAKRMIVKLSTPMEFLIDVVQGEVFKYRFENGEERVKSRILYEDYHRWMKDCMPGRRIESKTTFFVDIKPYAKRKTVRTKKREGFEPEIMTGFILKIRELRGMLKNYLEDDDE